MAHVLGYAPVRQALLAAKAHVHLALTDAALPGKETEESEQGALDDAVARKPTIVSMTTGGARAHRDLEPGQNDQMGRIPYRRGALRHW